MYLHETSASQQGDTPTQVRHTGIHTHLHMVAPQLVLPALLPLPRLPSWSRAWPGPASSSPTNSTSSSIISMSPELCPLSYRCCWLPYGPRTRPPPATELVPLRAPLCTSRLVAVVLLPLLLVWLWPRLCGCAPRPLCHEVGPLAGVMAPTPLGRLSLEAAAPS